MNTRKVIHSDNSLKIEEMDRSVTIKFQNKKIHGDAAIVFKKGECKYYFSVWEGKTQENSPCLVVVSETRDYYQFEIYFVSRNGEQSVFSTCYSTHLPICEAWKQVDRATKMSCINKGMERVLGKVDPQLLLDTFKELVRDPENAPIGM